MANISPRVDIAFKKIFGVEENKDLLISLINSIVGQDDQVDDVILLNPYNLKNFKDDKLSILDIKAKGVNGKRFNVEIQITDEGDYDKRALYYWAKLYTEQLQTSERAYSGFKEFPSEYSRLAKSIGIHILNFTSIPGTDRYHNVFHICEKETGLLYFTDLELHTVELQKFSKGNREDLSDIVGKVKNSLDMWVAFLTRHDLLKADHLPSRLDDPALKKAIHVLDVMNFDAAEREAYEGHLKWLMIEASTLSKKFNEGVVVGKQEGIVEGIALGKQEGIALGKQEGIAEGIARGKEEGKIQGIAEGEEKMAKKFANRLILLGHPLEEICQLTGLSMAVVQELSLRKRD